MFHHNWSVPFGVLGGSIFLGIGGLILAISIFWSVYWKGRALWKAAQRKELYWFITLLLINTLGILEILYLYVFTKEDLKKEEKK